MNVKYTESLETRVEKLEKLIKALEERVKELEKARELLTPLQGGTDICRKAR